MSREIKFRCWEYNNKIKQYKMNYSPNVYDDECFAEWSQVRLNEAINNGGVADYDMQNKTVFMQYTGLHDKNGVEIYESDIVEVRMSFEGGSLPCMGEIVYMEEFGAFATKNEGGETLLHNHLLNTFEVIGNIYEEKKCQKS